MSQRLQKGDRAPDFTLTGDDGKTYSLMILKNLFYTFILRITPPGAQKKR